MGIIKSRLQDTKTYGLPTLALMTITVVKLYLVGAIDIMYQILTDTPMYMENTTLEWWKIFIILMLDMVVGIIYVWVKNINKDYEEGDNKGDESVERTPGDAPGEDNNNKETLIDDGLKRGFNYIWMSGLSSILVSIMWAIVVVLVTNVFEGAIISHPSTLLMLYVILGGIQFAITGVIKRGILVYTVFATYGESNILKALKFSIVKVFRIVAIDIVYYSWVILGMLLAGIGVIITVPQALHNQTKRWERLMRDFEREDMYSYFGR